MFDLESSRRVAWVRRPWKKGANTGAAREAEVLSVAVSSDSRLLASGGRDRLVRLYDLRMLAKKAQLTVNQQSGQQNGQEDAKEKTSSLEQVTQKVTQKFTEKVTELVANSTGPGASAGAGGLELRSFRGHKDAVTCLGFQVGGSTLFTGSLDRTLKLWNVKDMGFMDTLYGHQCAVSPSNPPTPSSDG